MVEDRDFAAGFPLDGEQQVACGIIEELWELWVRKDLSWKKAADKLPASQTKEIPKAANPFSKASMSGDTRDSVEVVVYEDSE